MYINNSYFYVLDIETSKAIVGDSDVPNVTWLSYGYLNKYDTKGNTIEKNFFREWSELKNIFDIIEKTECYKYLIFVHNLSFEGDFLIKNISSASSFCSNDNHHFITLQLQNYKKIEFRCSYAISDMSLRELGKNVGLEKLDNDYKTYFPSDKINEIDKEYCCRDCDIVAVYISHLLKIYKRPSDIVITKTGIVRKTMRNYYDVFEKGKDWDIYPDENVYDLINDAFIGGVSTVNPKFCGIEVKNVHCYDKKSSYPSVMLINKYPSHMKKVDYCLINEFKQYKHFIVRIRLLNLRSKFEWGWLSASKCDISGEVTGNVFNGKIINMNEWIETTLTDVDYENLINTYTFSDYEIVDGCVSNENDKLPKCYIKTIEKYAKGKYLAKNEYKNNPTVENYHNLTRAKSSFNSIYGMCVQKICPQEFNIDEYGVWEKKDKEYKKLDKHLYRNFLYGVYITAYARKSLLDTIIENCPNTFVYCDTDSIKFVGENKIIDRTPELVEYKDNESIYGLGKFEYEGTYDKFKCYGAKKYGYEINGKFQYVVSGLPKFKKEITMSQFRLNTFFNNCKLASIYLCDNKNDSIITINGIGGEEYQTNCKMIKLFKKKHNIVSNGGVALFPVGYMLNMNDIDIDYIKRKYKREIV